MFGYKGAAEQAEHTTSDTLAINGAAVANRWACMTLSLIFSLLWALRLMKEDFVNQKELKNDRLVKLKVQYVIILLENIEKLTDFLTSTYCAAGTSTDVSMLTS